MNATDRSALPAVTSRPYEPFVMGIIGSSGSGKTKLLEDLIVHLRCEGMTVSAIKRTHDEFDLDRPGKDSFRLREAGCGEVVLVSNRRWALLHESAESIEPRLDQLLPHMSRVDVVLVEGFRALHVPSIEVFRPGLGRPPLWPQAASIVAVASDENINCDRPRLDLNDVPAIACFILNRITGTAEPRWNPEGQTAGGRPVHMSQLEITRTPR